MSTRILGAGRKQGNDAQLSSIVNPDENEPVTDISTLVNCKPIISGYLYKRGRQGKWQKRWFESDGKCLFYFKSEKRKKLLATLDLFHVGSVAMDDTDPADSSFTIEVAGRNYYLCADSKDHAMDWVISMNRVREARMEIGNLKLIEPRPDDDITPRVVMVATRKRAKGLGTEDFNEGDNTNDVSGFTEESSPGSGTESVASSNISSRHEASGPAGQPPNRRQSVLGRWTKQRPSYQNWMRRLSRWGMRLKSVRCVVREDFQHLSKFVKGKHSIESTHKSTSVDTPIDGGSIGLTPSAKDGAEASLDPTSNCPQLADLNPEVRGSLNLEQVHITGQSLNQILHGNTTRNETPISQVNDDVYTSFEQKMKFTSTGGMASHSRVLREKMEEASSRENIANGDVDSSSGLESFTTIDEDANSTWVV